MPNSVTETAAAKVNLYLHVTGKRPDGYHEIQSLVAFADAGDQVTAVTADGWSLAIDGPHAPLLASGNHEDNLALRAARQLAGSGSRKAALTLTKNLPVASGIGGGSADAAATLRALKLLLGLDFGDASAWAGLGADIPVCLLNQPALVEGMGEKLTPVSGLPALPAVLVNPGIPSGTAAVFQALARSGQYGTASSSPLPAPADLRSPETLAAWLAQQRNDLAAPAIETLPVIADVLAALAAVPGNLLARMSGSGATCFGLFSTEEVAAKAGAELARQHPDWWILPTKLSAPG